MGVSSYGGSHGVGGITVGGYLCLPPPEHSCTIHCNQVQYGPVSRDGEASRVMGVQSMVVAVKLVLVRDVDGGSGGGTE